ncbi:MAG: hypothetical protein ABI600_15160 [Luteolibacter sp.]
MNFIRPILTGIAFLLFAALSVHAQSVDGFNPDADYLVRSPAVQANGKIPVGDILLKAASQKLNATASHDGLWIESTESGAGGVLRLKAASVGRVNPDHSCHFEVNGQLISNDDVVSFIRPGIVEEYRVGVDGVRQDFILADRPPGSGELILSLSLSGAEAGETAQGIKLTLDKDKRELIYSRLHVTDSAGKVMSAAIKVADQHTLQIQVDDSMAIYPIRIDPTFSDADWIAINPTYPGTNGAIRVIMPDNFGNIYVGGEFTIAGDIAASRIAKWNGTNWTALGVGLNGSVYAIEIDSSGNVYAGGGFTTAGGASAKGVAKWNGSAWASLGTGVNGTVSTLEVDSSGNIYAGGDFTVAGSIGANRIAKWNGSTWSALGSGTSGNVLSIAASADGNLYACGQFLTAGGVPVNLIARWNGSAWFALGTGMNGLVYSLATDSSGILYAGGEFTSAGGVAGTQRVARWNGTAWSRLNNPSGSSMPASSVYDIKIDFAGKLYIGGYQINGGGTVTVWDGSSFETFQRAPSIIYAIGINAFGKVFAGGSFDPSVYNTTAANIGTYENYQFLGLHSQLIFGSVNAVAADSSDSIYVSGALKYSGDIGGNYIARWNGANWSHVGDRSFSSIVAMAVDNSGSIYVCDNVALGGGSTLPSCSKWDGTAWSDIGTFNYAVSALALDTSGNLYAGGSFTTAGGVNASRIAKWSDGVWSSLGTGLDGSVLALALGENDSLYVGGYFTFAGGVVANKVAK